MIRIDDSLTPQKLQPKLNNLFNVAATSTRLLRDRWDPAKGTPVFTIDGAYTTRGWTEWTQGFQYGNAILLYDATDESEFLDYGRGRTVDSMAHHVSHTGVHDHGFNNVSTYGNLLRLMSEGRIAGDRWEAEFYRLALKVSGAVQAARWTALPGNLGYVHSFNGPHSLFSDTIRSMRALGAAHVLGHVLMAEQDESVSLLRRSLQHAETTARYNVYFGEGRDSYDVSGRVVHESIFNTESGAYRCPSSQQGYSPFTTWTRGLSWVLCGYPEELEFLATLEDAEFHRLDLPYFPNRAAVEARFLEVATTVADYYIENTPTDGVPFWDTGAPGLAKLPGYLDRPADPFNSEEPVDSSAAAICAQGLLRLGRYLRENGGDAKKADRYLGAGLTIADTIFDEPYLATDGNHQGILLHSVYHRPNGWDQIHDGQKVPNGEACMWGDYHALELALYLKRLAEDGAYYSFFGGLR